MGNGKSTIITIDLNDTDQNKEGRPYNIDKKDENYNNFGVFEKVTFKVKQGENTSGYDIHLHFHDSKPFFKYQNPSSDKDRLEELCSFFSKHYRKRPLVIGFKGNEEYYYYYVYKDLKYIQSGNTLDVRGLDPFDLTLKERLKYEDDVIKTENTITGDIPSGEARIYLSNKGDTESTYSVKIKSKVTCSIDVTKEQYNNCKNIAKVLYKIIYFGDEQFNFWHDTWYRYSNSYYYLNFSAGTDASNAGKHIFTYYPRDNGKTILEVEGYFCLMYINQPFLLRFKTNELKYIYTSYDELDYKRSAYDNKLKSDDKDKIDNLINEYYTKKFRKLTFKKGDGSNQDIKTRKYEFNSSVQSSPRVMFTKVILTSKGSSKLSTVSSNCLLTLNQSDGLASSKGAKSVKSSQTGKITNKPIKEAVFSDVKKGEKDGLVICYTHPDEIALFVEIYNDRNTKHQFQRVDLDGDNWKKGNLEYDRDTLLAQQLQTILSDIATRITYRLENNKSYSSNIINVNKVKHSSDGYTIYEHKPSNPSKLVITHLLYNGNKIDIVENKNIRGNDNLTKLDGTVFTQIDTYSHDTNANEHVLMKLTKKDGSFFIIFRFGKDGNKWKQIDLDETLQIVTLDPEYLGLFKKVWKRDGLAKNLGRIINDTTTTKQLLTDITSRINSIILLIEFKHTYSGSAIKTATRNDKDIPPIEPSYSVEVNNETCSTSEHCVKVNGYDMYKHDLTSVLSKVLETSQSKTLNIRLFLRNNKIFMYQNKEGPQTYLIYLKGMNELYVYFEKDGSDPLMVFYNKKAYIPKDKSSYNSRWVMVSGISDLKSAESTIRENLEKAKQFVDKSKPETTTGPVSNTGINNGGSPKTQEHGDSSASAQTLDTKAGLSGHSPKREDSNTDQVTVGSDVRRNSTTQDTPGLTGTHAATSLGTRSSAASSAKGSLQTSPSDSGQPNQNQGSKGRTINREQHHKTSNGVDHNSDRIDGLNSSTQDTESEAPTGSSDGSDQAKIYGGAGGGTVGAIGAGAGGYLIYAKLILPRRL